MEIELPDGTILEAPDDADPSVVAKNYLAKQQQSPDPTEGMSTRELFTAGMGQSFNQLRLGAKQIAGPGIRMVTGTEPEQALQERETLKSEIGETREIDAPLLETTAGTAGNIAGNIAALAPAALIPGANTLAGATVAGAALGAAQPTIGDESRAVNAAVGAGAGATGFVGGKAIQAGVTAAKRRIAEAAAQKAQNAARDATLAQARAEGFIVAPSEVNPGFVTNILERWAGKASVAQQASLRNQRVTNKLVRESLGLPEDTPITPESLTPIKRAAWSVYDQTKKLGILTADKTFKDTLAGLSKLGKSKLTPNKEIVQLAQRLRQNTLDAEDVVESIKTLRFEAKTNLGPMNFNPVTKRLGKAQSAAADALEGLIERNISPGTFGRNFVDTFKQARVTLGKVGTVERAMVESTGNVSARKLAAELAKGKPLTGKLRDVARFTQAFPRMNQLNVNPIPGGSPLDMAAAGVSTAAGSPGLGALLLGRPVARSAVLSRVFQKAPSDDPLTSLALSKVPVPARTPQALGILAPSITTSNRNRQRRRSVRNR